MPQVEQSGGDGRETVEGSILSPQKLISNLGLWAAKLGALVESQENLLRRKGLTGSSYDPLLEAEGALSLHAFEVLLRYLRQAATCELKPETHMAILRLAEIKAIHEKVAALKTKCEPRWDKIKRNATEDVVVQNDLKARPEMFVTLTGEAKAIEVEGGLYKAPKTFAVEYAKDKEQRKRDEHEDPEWVEKEQERLRHSEFARAITADILPTPEIVGNGEEDLDAVSQKLLRKYKAAEKYGEENMTSVKRRKVDEKKYRDIQRKQRLLTVGGALDDLGQFASRLGKK